MIQNLSAADIRRLNQTGRSQQTQNHAVNTRFDPINDSVVIEVFPDAVTQRVSRREAKVHRPVGLAVRRFTRLRIGRGIVIGCGFGCAVAFADCDRSATNPCGSVWRYANAVVIAVVNVRVRIACIRGTADASGQHARRSEVRGANFDHVIAARDIVEAVIPAASCGLISNGYTVDVHGLRQSGGSQQPQQDAIHTDFGVV